METSNECELTCFELCRVLECKEEEFDDFEEVDLSYLSSDTLTKKYISIPVLDMLKNLEKVTICNHLITDLSPFKHLKKLKSIDLSHNLITNMTPLLHCCLLEELHLDHNNLSIFPKDLYKLHNLRVLTLSRNKITYDSFQDLLSLINLQSLDLKYNPVVMRDKENRRDIVYFLHNRLKHFELFNGMHINTLFARVSCGKDYLDDIIDTDHSSPLFYVPQHHIRIIGERKNLKGIKPFILTMDSFSSGEIPVSPFCLEDSEEDKTPNTPHTPTYSLRLSQKHLMGSKPLSAQATMESESEGLNRPFFLNEENRLRSMSMFESLDEEMDRKDARGMQQRERTFSVHDVILQSILSKDAYEIEENKDKNGESNASASKPRSLFGNMGLNILDKSAPKHQASIQQQHQNQQKQRYDERSLLIGKIGHRNNQDGIQKLLDEMKRMSTMLHIMNEREIEMQNAISGLEKKVDLIIKETGIDYEKPEYPADDEISLS